MNKIYDRSAKAGFTLVELIVVIAILAILAGIAIPVYNGYIKKAHQAADEQLIAAVNSAAAAAVLETYGKDMANQPDGALVTSATKGTDHITISSPADLAEAFGRYFAGNESAKLEHYEALSFEGGVFKGVDSVGDVLRSVMVGDKNYTYKQSAVDMYNGSSFTNAEVSELTGMVDTLSGALANSGGLQALANTSEFHDFLVSNGVLAEGENVTSATLSDAAKKREIANASVLYVAKKASELDADSIYNAVKNGNSISSLLTSGGFETGVNDTFVETAIKFGLVTSFVNSEYGEDYKSEYNTGSAGITGLTTAANFYSDFSSKGEFSEYMDAMGKEDIQGFLSAMSVIKDNAGNFDLSGQYSDPALVEAVDKILNGN